MAKKFEAAAKVHVSKSKKRGVNSKKESNNKASKNYAKSYRGQGR